MTDGKPFAIPTTEELKNPATKVETLNEMMAAAILRISPQDVRKAMSRSQGSTTEDVIHSALAGIGGTALMVYAQGYNFAIIERNPTDA